ncbi:hypothetical protein BJ138DRAFT_1007286, partial [Hygrophoropsis aurantiaca]
LVDKSTARRTLRPAAPASFARVSKIEVIVASAERAEGLAGKDLGCQTVVKRSSRLLSVIGTGSASGARAISKPSIVKRTRPSELAIT